MHVSDGIYLGSVALGSRRTTSERNPTAQIGVGPMAQVHHLAIIPAAVGTANLAALAAPTSGTALTLTAGAGITAGTAPDGSGSRVYSFDVERAVSLTSTSNLSAINFLVTGYNRYGQRQTQLMAGPNNNTVNSLKAFLSILSIVPQGTSASTVSAGSSDVFGLPFALPDITYITSVKWAATLANNAGTAVAADTTSPATASTGDPRGTYTPAGAASNGSNRLVLGQYLDATQCGSSATVLAAYGVTPA